MEGVVMDYFNNYNIVREVNTSSTFHSYLGEDKNKDSIDTHTHMISL